VKQNKEFATLTVRKIFDNEYKMSCDYENCSVRRTNFCHENRKLIYPPILNGHSNIHQCMGGISKDVFKGEFWKFVKEDDDTLFYAMRKIH
jgi:hypothetical protein